MENYKNLKEDNDLFPYEYGSLIYNDVMMNKRILDLFRRKEVESNMDLICKHMEENGVVFSSPGESFQRKLLAFLTRYMNYRLRHPHRAEILKKDDKLRQLLDPLAKIICTEKSNLEEWKKKNPNGYGEYNYPNGEKYAGEWKDGEYHGQGILSWSGRLIYEGEWANGQRNGHGTTMTKDDKLGYNGEWKDDKYHGQGIYIVQNDYFNNEEVKYEGEWKNGKEHGQGSQKAINWEAVGEFKDGNRWNVILYDKDRNIRQTIKYGEEVT